MALTIGNGTDYWHWHRLSASPSASASAPTIGIPIGIGISVLVVVVVGVVVGVVGGGGSIIIIGIIIGIIGNQHHQSLASSASSPASSASSLASTSRNINIIYRHRGQSLSSITTPVVWFFPWYYLTFSCIALSSLLLSVRRHRWKWWWCRRIVR